MGSLVAGTIYRGQFEKKLKKVLKEITDSNGKTILFIDEIHTLVGAGDYLSVNGCFNLYKCVIASTIEGYG